MPEARDLNRTLGAVRDVTGSFDAVLWVCAGFATLLSVAGFFFSAKGMDVFVAGVNRSIGDEPEFVLPLEE